MNSTPNNTGKIFAIAAPTLRSIMANLSLARLRRFVAAVTIANTPRAVQIDHAFQHSHRYPEWRGTRKTRGRRDASIRSRANRRKAAKARKAGAR